MELSLNEELNSMMRSVSRNIGEYDLSPDPIHIGNNGQIFTMKNRLDSRLHVLKVFWKRGPHPNTETKGSDKAYTNEKRIHESLKNRYIVQLYNTFQDETNSYMVLEHCQGGNLRKIMKSPIAIQVVRDYGLQIGKGLAYLHKKEIIHRDLRPQNILLTSDSQIKICDFGMAVKCAQGEQVREFRGGFGYIPPEAIELHNEKFDIWSLGCILHEMALGFLPFKCNNWKQLNLINQQYLKKYNFDSKLSPALLHLLKRIFVYDKNKRISIEELLVHPFFTNQPLPPSPQKIVQKGINKKSSSKTLFKSLELRESKHQNKENVNKQNIPLKSTAPDYKKLILDKKNQKEGKSQLKIQLSKNGTPTNSRPTSGDKTIHTSKMDQYSTLRDRQSKSNLPINYDVRNKAYQPKKTQLSPLKTNGMIIKPITIKKNIIRIDEQGLTRQDEKIENNWIKVSCDGRIIRISKQDQEKKYVFEQLPQKYYKIYEECKKIVQQIQSQTPKISFSIKNVEMRIMFDGKIHLKLNQEPPKILQQSDLLSNKRSLPQKDFNRLRKIYTNLCTISRQSE